MIFGHSPGITGPSSKSTFFQFLFRITRVITQNTPSILNLTSTKGFVSFAFTKTNKQNCSFKRKNSTHYFSYDSLCDQDSLAHTKIFKEPLTEAVARFDTCWDFRGFMVQRFKSFLTKNVTKKYTFHTLYLVWKFID